MGGESSNLWPDRDGWVLLGVQDNEMRQWPGSLVCSHFASHDRSRSSFGHREHLRRVNLYLFLRRMLYLLCLLRDGATRDQPGPYPLKHPTYTRARILVFVWRWAFECTHHSQFVCFGAQSFAKVFQRGNSSALRGQVRAKPHGGVSFVKGQRRQRTVRGIIRVGCAIETGHLNCYNIQ